MFEYKNNVIDFLVELYCKNFKAMNINLELANLFANELINLGLIKHLGIHKDNKNINNKISLLLKKIRKIKKQNKNNSLIGEQKNKIQKVNKENSPWNLLNLNNKMNFLDFGCNNFVTINKLADSSKDSFFIGVDVLDFNLVNIKYKERCIYKKVSAHLNDLPYFLFEHNLSSTNATHINLKLVLHHITDDLVLEKLFSFLKHILNKETKIFLWEESYEKFGNNNLDIKNLVLKNNKFGILSDFNLTQTFNNFNADTKKEIISINDALVNYSNPHIQWPAKYRSWLEWEKIFYKYGFCIKQKFNLGIRINSKMQQGIQIIGVFGVM